MIPWNLLFINSLARIPLSVRQVLTEPCEKGFRVRIISVCLSASLPVFVLPPSPFQSVPLSLRSASLSSVSHSLFLCFCQSVYRSFSFSPPPPTPHSRPLPTISVSLIVRTPPSAPCQRWRAKNIQPLKPIYTSGIWR